MNKQGDAAETDPPEGARPARDTGVSVPCSIATLTHERDEARRQRDDAHAVLALTNETLALMNRAFLEMQRQRDEVEAALQEARAAARDYLPHVKFSFDDLNRGKQYERAERERLSWLGPPETPLEACGCDD